MATTLRILNRKAAFNAFCLRACLLFAAALVFLFFRETFGITCLIKHVTGISCPTCGMSGAMICLLSGDFAGYIVSNAFALPVGAVILSLLFPALWKQKPFLIAATVTLGANAVYYLVRIFTRAI